MLESTITCNTWRQGHYNGSTYTVDPNHIVTDLIEIPFGIQTLSCSWEGNQTVWIKKKVGDTFTAPSLYTAVSPRYYLFDSSETVIKTGVLVRGGTVDVSACPTARYIAIAIEADWSGVTYSWAIRPNEETTNDGERCIAAPFEFGFSYLHWTMYTDGFPRSDEATYFPADFSQPLPKSKWRVDQYHNDGFPWNALIPDIPYMNMFPHISQGMATEITDASSLPYKRVTTSGYTNPDLIRFQDEEFAENTTQKVGIFGVNSYRYMETDDYEDGSTTCEIP